MIDLYLDGLLVGTFTYGSKWVFKYSNEYNLDPLWEFPKLDEVYESDYMFNMLRCRIPSKKKSKYKDEIERLRNQGNNMKSRFKIKFND